MTESQKWTAACLKNKVIDLESTEDHRECAGDIQEAIDLIEQQAARIAELTTCKLCRSPGPDVPCAYPTEINRQQAKRIAELESAQSSQQGAETFVLRALVAAGHVSQAKVDEAFRIAANTPGVAHPHATESDRRDAWQPIETAPKDGTPLILFARSVKATASIPIFGWYLDEHGWIAQSFRGIEKIVPSHWMPRPEFPSQTPAPGGE